MNESNEKGHPPKILRDSIPEHERPLGRFSADTKGESFFPLRSLDEARCHTDGVVILQGDDGGQIYVVVRATQVLCSSVVLESLLVELDSIAWPGNDPSMRRTYYERLPLGSPVWGGMGGASVTEEPWIHPEFLRNGLAPVIEGVLRGEREHLT